MNEKMQCFALPRSQQISEDSPIICWPLHNETGLPQFVLKHESEY